MTCKDHWPVWQIKVDSQVVAEIQAEYSIDAANDYSDGLSCGVWADVFDKATNRHALRVFAGPYGMRNITKIR